MKNLYILLISALFFACGNSEKNTETIEKTSENENSIQISQKQFEKEGMQFGTLTEQPFHTVVKVNGMIDVPPENRASVSTFVGGYVSKIPLLVGDKIKKGQLVASLTNTEFVEIQQEYQEIAAQLNYLKNEFNRQKTLFDEKITSEKNYLKAESTYKSNLAVFNGLRRKLQMMNINPKNVEKGQITATINLYAPINGYVTKVNVSNGAFVSSASELLEIVNTEHIHLELTVFEKDILKIKKDQKIKFKIPESSDKTFNADVHLVGTSINSDRTIKVHGHLENEDVNFITGMFVEAEIFVDSNKKIAMPKSATLKNDTHYFALVLKEEKNETLYFKKVLLEVGATNEDYIEILNPEVLKNKSFIKKGISMFSEI